MLPLLIHPPLSPNHVMLSPMPFPSPPVLPLGMNRITYPSALTVSYISDRRDWKDERQGKVLQKIHWTDMWSYTEYALYNLLLLLYLFSFAILWKTGGNKTQHGCQLQSRRKEKPLPLWAVITSHDRWLPTLSGRIPGCSLVPMGPHKQLNKQQ